MCSAARLLQLYPPVCGGHTTAVHHLVVQFRSTLKGALFAAEVGNGHVGQLVRTGAQDLQALHVRLVRAQQPVQRLVRQVRDVAQEKCRLAQILHLGQLVTLNKEVEFDDYAQQ